MHSDRVSISAFVDPDDHERLVERARAEERSVSAELRVAIREHLGVPARASLRSARPLTFTPSTTTTRRHARAEHKRHAEEEAER